MLRLPNGTPKPFRLLTSPFLVLRSPAPPPFQEDEQDAAGA